MRKILGETAKQFKSFINGSQSTKSTPKQLNDSIRPTTSNSNVPQFSFEMALKYNEAAAKRAKEILFPQQIDRLLYESVLFSEISELSARR